MKHRSILVLTLLLAAPARLHADGARDLVAKPDDWFRSDAGRKAVDCILSWQSPRGDWPKNQDTTRKPFAGDRTELQGTFDNGATTAELRVLARAFHATADPRCKEAFLAGLDQVLAAQYANGGWPQFHPPGNSYHRHITFNDNSMVRLLEFTREVAAADAYRFVPDPVRRACRKSFDRGIACILECQVIVADTPTVWCAQHDERTLAPAKARSYELPSLSGCESAGILRLLMTIEKPSPNVVRAVKNGVSWFEKSAIRGIRIDTVDGDRVVVKDSEAAPQWARFYDIDTNRPFFCGRDGVKKSSLAEIDRERRTGYAWYGRWGEQVAKDHAAWARR